MKKTNILSGIRLMGVMLLALAVSFIAVDFVNGFIEPGGAIGATLAFGPIIMVTMADVTHNDLSNNMPGVQTEIIYFRTQDLRAGTFPTPNLSDPSGAGSLADLVTIDEDIYFAAGKGPSVIYVTPETGEVMSKFQGEVDNKSFRNEFKFTHPGQSATFLGFLTAIKNADLGFVIRENNGQYRLLGNPLFPAKVSDGETGTGMATTGKRGGSVTIYDSNNLPAPIWTGNFVVTSFSGQVQSDFPLLFS